MSPQYNCPKYDTCLGLCEACREERHIDDGDESEEIKQVLLENWFNNSQQKQRV